MREKMRDKIISSQLIFLSLIYQCINRTNVPMLRPQNSIRQNVIYTQLIPNAHIIHDYVVMIN